MRGSCGCTYALYKVWEDIIKFDSNIMIYNCNQIKIFIFNLLPGVVGLGIGCISLLHSFVLQSHSSTIYSWPFFVNGCSAQPIISSISNLQPRHQWSLSSTMLQRNNENWIQDLVFRKCFSILKVLLDIEFISYQDNQHNKSLHNVVLLGCSPGSLQLLR